MRIPRFIISEKDISWSDACSFSLSLKEEDKHHLLNVLRRKPNDSISLFIQEQNLELFAEIVSTKDSLQLQLLEKKQKLSTQKIILLIGLTKASTADFICEKLTELGASEIHFFSAERSQYVLDDVTREKRLARLEKIIEAAKKQSGSVVSTVVGIHSDLGELLSAIEKEVELGSRLCLSTGNAQKINEYLNTQAKSATQSTVLLIGCEGGFTESELGLARSRGFVEVSLGANVLRSETAAMLACALVALYRE